MTDQEKPYFVKLPHRGLITISGTDRHIFLQAIISNDINLLKTQDSIYACLLTPQGKFLHDFFVFERDESLIIDCEGGSRTKDLVMRFMMYKLRSKIEINADESVTIYALNTFTEGGYRDTRRNAMGYRSIKEPQNIEEFPFDIWDKKRISSTIPDGSRDMEVEKSTLLECNIDKLNGVCFKKGCYVGQELTARMHYRGLAKKHLYTVEGEVLPESGADIVINEKCIGEMRSQNGGIGLALLKDDDVKQNSAALPFTVKAPLFTEELDL